MSKIKIIFPPTNEKPFIVIWKPKGLPSAPLHKDDKYNALSQAGELFPDVFNVKGRKDIEYGLLHRLDNDTDGILVIAVTQDCYNFLQMEQKNGNFVKYYSALCRLNNNNSEILQGFPHCNIDLSDICVGKRYIISSYFRGFGKGSRAVRPVTEESGRAALKKIGKPKIYNTEILVKDIDKNKESCLVQCKILSGYRHQVRCHLGWCGLPIINDSIYNSDSIQECEISEFDNTDKKNAENLMKFSATKLEFEYPRGDLNSYEIALTWT